MADGLLNKASIILTPTGYKAGTLYNVAPVVEPYEDFDFARASVASRVNSSGLVEMVGRTLGSELVTNGDFATDSDWNKVNSTISEGKGNLDGNGQTSLLWQDILTNGNSYKATFTVSDYNGSGSAKVIDNSANTIFDITSNGTFTINFTHSIANGNFLFRALSGAVFSVDNVSVKEVIDTNNIPRISYDSNGDNGHILLEPTSTNLVTYSETFENWTEQNSSVTTNTTTSPSGENNASKLVENNADNQHRIDFTSTSSASTVTFSVFLKKDERQYAWTRIGSSGARFDLDNGNITNISADITADSINYGNGWYRYIITKTSASSNEICRINSLESLSQGDYQGDGTSGIYIWGAQLEELSYATSYIPTLTGSQEVRATETATGAGSADLINSTEGVLYAEIAALVNGGANRYISLSDNTTSNRLNVIFSSNADRLTISGTGNIGSFTNVNFFSYTQNIYNKIAIKYSSSGVKLFVNGSLEGSNSDNVSWTSNTLTTLDFSLWNQSTALFEGKVKALAVFNEALSDSELTQLTT